MQPMFLVEFNEVRVVAYMNPAKMNAFEKGGERKETEGRTVGEGSFVARCARRRRTPIATPCTGDGACAAAGGSASAIPAWSCPF